MSEQKPLVTVDRYFELGFKLPSVTVNQAPSVEHGALTLDRINVMGETWRLLFSVEDADEMAEIFETLAAKIHTLIKETTPP